MVLAASGATSCAPSSKSGRTDIEVVAVNDLGPVETNAHLLRYDSVHGKFPHEVTVNGDMITAGGQTVQGDGGEGPGRAAAQGAGRRHRARMHGHLHQSKEKASAHLTAGAKKVIVSAPADGADYTIVYGVNDKGLSKEHVVISNGSCTTNCLAPMAMIMNELVGIEKGMMTTIHSYTGDQPTLDTMHKDLYRARAAALSQIPTSTGAAKAIGLVLPELKGKLDGISIRVPTPNVSLVDLKFVAKRNDHAAGGQRRADRRVGRQAQGHHDLHAPPAGVVATSTTIRIRRRSCSTRPR